MAIIIKTPITIGTIMTHAGISSFLFDVGVITGTPIMVACGTNT